MALPPAQNSKPEADPSVDRDALFERCYGELRRIANHRMSRLPSGATLQPTALLHEAYLRVRSRRDLDGPQEKEFILYTSRAMRDILVEKARSVASLKRSGSSMQVSLDDVDEVGLPAGESLDLLDLEAALEGLETAAPLAAEVVQLRYFGGLTIAEISRILDVSTKTVERRWDLARAWLARNMASENGGT